MRNSISMIVLALSLCGASVGCSRLNVDVAIYNPSPALKVAMDSNEVLARLTRNFASGEYEKRTGKLQHAYRQIFEINTGVNRDDTQLQEGNAAIAKSVGEAKALHAKARNTLLEAGSETGVEVDVLRARGIQEAADGDQKITEVRKQIADFGNQVRNALLGKVRANVADKAAVDNGLRTETAAVRTSEAVTTGLLANAVLISDDPRAAGIISAPEECWKGLYNHSLGFTSGGNGDICIKMETLGVFTVKGLRVDATAVAAATSRALAQGVRMVAAAYGVPVPNAAAGTSEESSAATGTGLATTSTDIEGAERTIKAAKAKVAASKQAALRVLDSIFARTVQLGDSDPQKVTAAVTAIKTQYQLDRSEMSASTEAK